MEKNGPSIRQLQPADFCNARRSDLLIFKKSQTFEKSLNDLKKKKKKKKKLLTQIKNHHHHMLWSKQNSF